MAGIKYYNNKINEKQLLNIVTKFIKNVVDLGSKNFSFKKVVVC